MVDLTPVASPRDGFLRAIAGAESLLQLEQQSGPEAESQPVLLESALLYLQRALMFFLSEHLEEETERVHSESFVGPSDRILAFLQDLSAVSSKASLIRSELAHARWLEYWRANDSFFVDQTVRPAIVSGSDRNPAKAEGLIASDLEAVSTLAVERDRPLKELISDVVSMLLALDSTVVSLSQEC